MAKKCSSTVAAPFCLMIWDKRALVGDRRAEVPVRDVPEVVAVLGDQRLVEAELVLDLVDVRIGTCPPSAAWIGCPGATGAAGRRA
jgi:hypothetical protein